MALPTFDTRSPEQRRYADQQRLTAMAAELEAYRIAALTVRNACQGMLLPPVDDRTASAAECVLDLLSDLP